MSYERGIGGRKVDPNKPKVVLVLRKKKKSVPKKPHGMQMGTSGYGMKHGMGGGWNPATPGMHSMSGGKSTNAYGKKGYMGSAGSSSYGKGDTGGSLGDYSAIKAVRSHGKY